VKVNKGVKYRLVVGSALLSFTAAACTPAVEPTGVPAIYEPPPQVRGGTIVWSAAPEIDLFDQRGQLIRAAQESKFIAYYGGLTTTYPGFNTALSRDYARKINTRTDQYFAGTIRAHILQILDTDTGFKATVCLQKSNFALRWPDGIYHIHNASGRDEFVEFISDNPDALEQPPHTDPPSSPHTPPTSTSTPTPDTDYQWAAPTEDLFTGTGWTINLGSDLGEPLARCEAWGRSIEPSVPPDSAELIHTTVPPETLPAYPGW